MKYSLLLIMCRNDRQPAKIMLVAQYFLKLRFQPLKKSRRTIPTAANHPRNDEILRSRLNITGFFLFRMLAVRFSAVGKFSLVGKQPVWMQEN